MFGGNAFVVGGWDAATGYFNDVWALNVDALLVNGAGQPPRQGNFVTVCAMIVLLLFRNIL
jgi:hypothetical protein